MKKIVSIMLVCLFLLTGVLATSFAVSANGDVAFTNADFDQFIGILVSSLEAVTDAGTRAAKFEMYLDMGNRDTEIDARIAELNSGSAIADKMLSDLISGGMSKAQVELILQVLKSIPQADRAGAIDEFHANQDNGANYPELDPANAAYDADLEAAYKGIYDKYVSASFQATVFADYGLEYIDFVPFIRALTNNIHLTKDSKGRLCPLSVSDAFAANILTNVTAGSINGIALVDKYSVLDILLGSFSDQTTAENLDNFVGVFKGEDAYEIVGNISGDAEGAVDGVDVLTVSQYIVGWSSVKTEVDADQARYSAGAMIDPADETITTDDLLKLLQYLAQWPGLILGRATNNSYTG